MTVSVVVMSQQSFVEASPKRFAHTCRNCGGRYNVLIQVDILRVHQAACPHCGEKNFFDNRDGRLALPRPATAPNPARPAAAAQSAAVSAAAPPRPQPARSPEPKAKSEPAPVGRVAPVRPDPRTTSVLHDYRAARPKPTAPSPPRSKSKPGPKFLRRSPADWLPAGVNDFFDSLDFRWPRDLSGLRDLLRGRLGLLLIVGAGCGLLAIGLGWLSLQFPALYLSESTATYMQRLEASRPNKVLDRNGEVIGELFSDRSGSLTEKNFPRELATALVFTEDQNFYSHGGVHWPSVFRAFIANVFSWGYSQGGSTITQQLSRILLNDREKSIFRKLRELSLAYELESSLTKDQILLGYMNLVYLGHGSRGFETAARFYFEKSLKDLSFEERLALVCLPSAPERYSPLRNPDQLRRKMDAVYARMVDAGGAYTPPPEDEYKVAANEMLRALDKSPGESVFGNRVNDAPYVSEYIRQKIVQILGPSYEYDQGLQVYTTIDRKIQLAADRASREFVREKSPGFPPVKMKDGKIIPGDDLRDQLLREYGQMAIGPALYGIPAPARIRARLQTASIGLETRTGGVVFMQGGADFTSGNQLNRAIQMRRQTGSAIKPFVYSAGIESGQVNTGTLLDDRPIFVSLQNIARDREKDYWLPGNYSGVFEGEIPLRRALERSQNIPAIRVARAVGLERLGEQFRKFFFYKDSEFANRFREDDTVAIGSLEMSPLELATAFTAFGNNGVIRRPFLIRKIVNAAGEELWSAGPSYDEFQLGVPEERKVLPGDVAEVMVSLLGSSAKFGGVSKGGFSSPQLIGKTGTSNEYRDAWFVGSTPDMTAAVWMGFDQPAYSMPGGTGAGLAGPLFGRIFKAAPAPRQSYEFSPRAITAEICKSTGRKPTTNCPVKVKEIFAANFPPDDALAEDSVRPEPGKSGDASDDGPGTNSTTTNTKPDFSINSDSDFD